MYSVLKISLFPRTQLSLLWYAPSNLSLCGTHYFLGVDELENWHPPLKLFSRHVFFFLQRRKYDSKETYNNQG